MRFAKNSSVENSVGLNWDWNMRGYVIYVTGMCQLPDENIQSVLKYPRGLLDICKNNCLNIYGFPNKNRQSFQVA